MFDRIVSDPGVLGGKPIIKGTRISVEMVMEWMTSGASRDAGGPAPGAEDELTRSLVRSSATTV